MESIKEPQFQDYMGCAKNQAVLANLETDSGEKVIFSCVVVKFNRWGMKQDRTLLLTNHCLYNIKKDQVQRRISVGAVKAVSKSTKEQKEFIVHVKSEYDYRFESDFRKDIFEALKWVFYSTNKTNLPVYAVPDKLKEYATSKKDIIQGVEVNPNEQFRDKKEDKYPEGASSSSSNASMST